MASRLHPSEELSDISGIEKIALIAELAVDFDTATMLDNQLLRIFQSKTDQRIGRTFPGATATEAERLHFKHPYRITVEQPVQYRFIVRAQQFLGCQGAGERGDMLRWRRVLPDRSDAPLAIVAAASLVRGARQP